MALFVEKLLQPLYRKYNQWGDQEIYLPSLFPGTFDLENKFSDIRFEYNRLIKRYDDFAPFQEISPHQMEISNDDKWRLFFLKGANIWFPKNCEQMPKTAKIISAFVFRYSKRKEGLPCGEREETTLERREMCAI